MRRGDTSSMRLFNALIRTHHITSRKKVQRLRKAAGDLGVRLVLIRSGGAPGIMYAEGPDEAAVRDWVAAVQALRYKDYQCVHKPAPAVVADETMGSAGAPPSGFREIQTVSDFADEMERRGLGAWWRAGMGYSTR